MKTVDEIKSRILDVLEKAGLGNTHTTRDIQQAYTADGLIKAMKPHMDCLVTNKAVDGQMLADSFPVRKLMDQHIYPGIGMCPPICDDGWHDVVMESGEGYFFGEFNAKLMGNKTVGHFYEMSQGDLYGSKGFCYGKSQVTVREDGKAEGFEQASVNAYDRSEIWMLGKSRGQANDQTVIRLMEGATGEAHGQSRVFARDRSLCALHDQANGEFRGKSVGVAYDKSTARLYDRCCCVFRDDSTGQLYGKSVGRSHEDRKPDAGQIQVLSANARLVPIGTREAMKLIVRKSNESKGYTRKH